MLLKGAEILIKTLMDHGVDTIFGYPGGSVLDIYDCLYKYEGEIKHVLTAHEQGASHAADGYARSTGKVGVCLATSGPGATNLVTGIATAYMDSIPMIAITGNVPKKSLGKDSFQEVDIFGITLPITKHSYIVDDVSKLQDIILEAFKIAQKGRKGPVLIDIPKEIMSQKYEYKKVVPVEIERNTKYLTEEGLKNISELINRSEKPLIYAGGGVISSEAFKELKSFAEKINSPVSTSLMGKCAYSNESYLYTGMIGMHGTKTSNILATKSDLIICIGARFSDRVITNRDHIKNAKIIHIDVDPAEINKNIKVDDYIVGDIKETLNRLIPLIDEKKNEEWINEMNILKNEEKDSRTPDSIKKLFEVLNNLCDEEYIIVTDVGQHQMWTASNYKFVKERSFISSGGLGTMGFGVGAAIGSQIGNSDKKVILITGDGSFGMNCNELATISTNNLPIKIFVINNNVLGMVRQWQDLFYDKRYSQTTLDRKTDFVKLANAFGIKGLRINEADLESNLKEVLYSDEACVIDYVINNNLKVFPMVAPGESIGNLILEEFKEG